MAVIINGDTGIDKITDGSIVAADIGAGEVTQAKLASGVASTGPAFSAYRSTTQSISSGTQTKIQFNGEQFDTDNCFDSTTNYRFTPTVAGYYQINSSMNSGASNTPTQVSITIYKNGNVAHYGSYLAASGTIKSTANVSALVYCNGSTDYIEIYGYIVATTAAIEGSSPYNTWVTGHLVRAA